MVRFKQGRKVNPGRIQKAAWKVGVVSLLGCTLVEAIRSQMAAQQLYDKVKRQAPQLIKITFMTRLTSRMHLSWHQRENKWSDYYMRNEVSSSELVLTKVLSSELVLTKVLSLEPALTGMLSLELVHVDQGVVIGAGVDQGAVIGAGID